ncbi:restriction endonuclease subunit S [Rubritalea tangerina]|uniref:Restriction endonuclease subunit S n=1 Tax=Rubritalea tangerina TaxID=430798 RepID=A0ABW4Z9A6_9BACT
MSEWRTVPIKELYHGLYDGPHATPKPAEEGPIFLGIKNVTDEGSLDLKTIRHIHDSEFARWTKRVEPTEGDIVFTYEATLNRYAIIPKNFKGCLGRRMALIRPNTEVVDTRFLHFYFFSKQWRDVIESNKLTGATVDRIPLTTFPNYPVSLPPLPEQKRIAGILSAYDDLIENNLRRIQILEDMAQSLYREWFVHFRIPADILTKAGLPPQLTLTNDSPLGPIPEDWEVKKLGEIATVKWGDTSTTKKAYTEEGFVAYSAAGQDGLLDHFDNERTGIVLSAIGANCGRTWLAAGKWSSIKNTMQLWSDSPRLSTELLYLSTLGKDKWPKRGAAQPFISQGDAKGMQTVVPTAQINGMATSRIRPLFESIRLLEKKNKNLRETRDLLLPKLLTPAS